MVITDLAYDMIRTQIAAYAPERGGALYGPKGYPFVTHFEYDPEADTSSVSYVPSTRLIGNVPKVERETGLRFKGIIHSHPHGMFRPSGGDEQTVASFFRLNPHLSSMALPIVQQDRGGQWNSDGEFLRWYRAERRGEPAPRSTFGSVISWPAARPRQVEVLDEEFHVVPIFAHVQKVLRHLRASGLNLIPSQQLQPLKIANAELVGIVASSSQGHEFMYFVSLDYPIVAPVVLYQRKGTTDNLRVQWDGISNVDRSLVGIAETLIEEWKPVGRVAPRLTGGNPYNFKV